MSILARLKAETQTHHDAVERSIGLALPGLTLDHYARVLARFLGFYRPLERRLLAVPGLADMLPDLPGRRKAHLLAADLAALGRCDAVPDCPDLPALATATQALGCLYVLEGATLGGQLLRRHVGATLGLTPEAGCRFFAAYGDRVGEMWHSFREAVAGYVVTPEREADAVGAAVATFATLDRWLTAPTTGRGVDLGAPAGVK